MPTYTFRNSTGQTLEVYGSMRTPPPERLVLGGDGSYRAAGSSDDDALVWSRVYGDFTTTVRGTPGAVDWKDGSLPVARGLKPLSDGTGKPEPYGNTTIYRHANGLYTDKRGGILVRNHDDAKRVKDVLGIERGG